MRTLIRLFSVIINLLSDRALYWFYIGYFLGSRVGWCVKVQQWPPIVPEILKWPHALLHELSQIPAWVRRDTDNKQASRGKIHRLPFVVLCPALSWPKIDHFRPDPAKRVHLETSDSITCSCMHIFRFYFQQQQLENIQVTKLPSEEEWSQKINFILISPSVHQENPSGLRVLCKLHTLKLCTC